MSILSDFQSLFNPSAWTILFTLEVSAGLSRKLDYKTSRGPSQPTLLWCNLLFTSCREWNSNNPLYKTLQSSIHIGVKFISLPSPPHNSRVETRLAFASLQLPLPCSSLWCVLNPYKQPRVDLRKCNFTVSLAKNT